VREIIANALDECTLTHTAEPQINRTASGIWIIRDFGRGLEPRHLTQNEDPEKRRPAASNQLLGRFGVGLKDALATLDRHRVEVTIKSRHTEVSLARRDKHSFEGIPTLHAAIRPPVDDDFVGTEVRLEGIGDAQVETARRYFLRFSKETIVDDTALGQVILRKTGAPARIYVRGLRLAEEDNFAFSYNITHLTRSMERALNRERTAVGRSAYSDRVKAILLASSGEEVARGLMEELARLKSGEGSDEIQWLDVQVHAAKTLSATGKVVLVTAEELRVRADLVEDAEESGYKVTVVPSRLRARLVNETDDAARPVWTLDAYAQERTASFVYGFLTEEDLEPPERAVWDLREPILKLAGGKPRIVRSIALSETLRPTLTGGDRAMGVWEGGEGRIVIRRQALRSVEAFAATLLHEIAHARSGHADDLTREFEEALTELLGKVAASGLASEPRG
jgi:hypothetical protein